MIDYLDKLASMPTAFGQTLGVGEIRQQPEDFQVTEILGFKPSGEGEHLFLEIEKTALNTADVVRLLSKYGGVHPKNIGFAGLKDKHAITSQTFSVLTTGLKAIDWAAFDDPQIKILSINRHTKKLRRGVLKGNRFKIKIKHATIDKNQLEERLKTIQQQGFPNYFGSQRFGIEGRNLHKADALFNPDKPLKMKRQQRSFVLSAARSWVFNLILAARIKEQSWNQFKAGDIMNLNGSRQLFMTHPTDHLSTRLNQLDIHPTAPLIGKEDLKIVPSLNTLALENKIIEPYQHWQAGLKRFNVDSDRRPLRVAVKDFEWMIESDHLILTFILPASSYATALMQELFTVKQRIT